MFTMPAKQKNSSSSSLQDIPARILLVEDDPVLRQSIAEYLVRSGLDVTAVANGLDFYHALAEGTFAIAIIDLGLPDIDGMQLVEYARKNTRMRCIILTARASLDTRIAGYDSGADLYMIKPVDTRELAAAIASLLARYQADPERPEILGTWQLCRQQTTLITPTAAPIVLTAREMDFLHCLGAAPEKPVDRYDILATLGYRNDEFSSRALESLIRRLRRKIEAATDVSPILTHHGVGYSFNAPLVVR